MGFSNAPPNLSQCLYRWLLSRTPPTTYVSVVPNIRLIPVNFTDLGLGGVGPAVSSPHPSFPHNGSACSGNAFNVTSAAAVWAATPTQRWRAAMQSVASAFLVTTTTARTTRTERHGVSSLQMWASPSGQRVSRRAFKESASPSCTNVSRRTSAVHFNALSIG